MPRLIKSNYIRTAPIKTDADIIVEIQIIDTDAVFLSVEKAEIRDRKAGVSIRTHILFSNHGLLDLLERLL